MSDTILDALTLATPRLDEPTVRQAYRQLTHLLGMALTGHPFSPDKPITSTQIVLLRHALDRLPAAQCGALSEAAGQLHSLLTAQTPSAAHFDSDLSPTAVKPPVASGTPVEWSHDVYISFNRKDGARARRLYADLRAAGLLVHMDDEAVPGTETWQRTLEKAVRAAGCVVVIITPTAKGSDWLEREIALALDHHIPVLPLVMDGDGAAGLPASLANTRWTPMRTKREYQANLPKLVTMIQALNG